MAASSTCPLGGVKFNPNAVLTPMVRDVHDLEELCKLVRTGGRVKYLFFWGHQGGGALGAECLSQWYPAAFTVDGRRFATAEHFMMFGKAMLFGDEEVAERIVAARSPGAAKRLGREVRGFDEATWAERRFDIVVRGNEAKFGQNAELGDFLSTTGTKVLVEASPTDRIWGIGMAKDAPHATNPLEWRGSNLLGFALMEVRRRLVAGGASRR